MKYMIVALLSLSNLFAHSSRAEMAYQEGNLPLKNGSKIILISSGGHPGWFGDSWEVFKKRVLAENKSDCLNRGGSIRGTAECFDTSDSLRNGYCVSFCLLPSQ